MNHYLFWNLKTIAMNVKNLSESEINELLTAYDSQLKKLNFQVEVVKAAVKELKGAKADLKKIEREERMKKAAEERAQKAAERKAKAKQPAEVAVVQETNGTAVAEEASAEGVAVDLPTAESKEVAVASASTETIEATPATEEGEKEAKKKETKPKKTAKSKAKVKPEKKKAAPEKKEPVEAAKEEATPEKTEPAEEVAKEKAAPEAEQEELDAVYPEWDKFIKETLVAKAKVMKNNEFVDAVKEWGDSQGQTYTDQKVRGEIYRSLLKLAYQDKTLKKVRLPEKGFVYAMNDWFSEEGDLKEDYLV